MMLQTFEVANIRCGGCAATIKKALSEAGFESVDVDLSCEPRKVTAEIAGEAQLAHFKAILRKLGYPLSDEEISLGNSATLKAKSFISCAVGKFNVEDNTK
jgi:copper chaperone